LPTSSSDGAAGGMSNHLNNEYLLEMIESGIVGFDFAKYKATLGWLYSL